MTYAMILDNVVIDVLHNIAYEPQYPPTQTGLTITAVECEETVRVNMLYVNGVFIDPVQPETESSPQYRPTKGELAIMETQATIYEELNASMLASAEATAEIYETILLMGGNDNG